MHRQLFTTIVSFASSSSPGDRKIMSILPARKLRPRKVTQTVRRRTQPRPSSAASKSNSFLPVLAPASAKAAGQWRRQPQGCDRGTPKSEVLSASAVLFTSTPLPTQPVAPDSYLIVAHRDQLVLPSSSCVSLYLFIHYLQPHGSSFISSNSCSFLPQGILLLLLFSSFKKYIHWIDGRVVY